MVQQRAPEAKNMLVEERETCQRGRLNGEGRGRRGGTDE